MHGMHCQLLQQTGSQELAQPVAKKQQQQEQGLWGRHACQATALTCAPKGTSLKP